MMVKVQTLTWVKSVHHDVLCSFDTASTVIFRMIKRCYHCHTFKINIDFRGIVELLLFLGHTSSKIDQLKSKTWIVRNVLKQ